MKKSTTKAAARRAAAAKKMAVAEVKETIKAVETAASVAETVEAAEEVAAPEMIKKEEAAETGKETAKETTKETGKAAAKTAAKKTALKEEIYLQYLGKEISKDDLMKSVKEIWTKQMKKKVGDMKTVSLYLKPEENRAYFVINGDVTGSIEL